jgi:hypothetical protein
MDSPQINKSWNKYETALLIDTYEKVSKGVVGRTDAVRQLSKRLRDGMTAMGVSISDTFRNENGISMQMSTIKNLLTDIDSTFGNPSHVFIDMCDLYINNRESFNKILGTASRMFPLGYSELTIQDSSSYDVDCDFALSPDFYVSLHKETIIDVFKRRFRNGMRLTSTIDRRKFRSTYKDISNISLDDMSDDSLITSIKRFSIVYDDTAYMPELMISENLKRKIVSYIQERFLDGDSCVFFEIIYNNFNEEFLESQILNVDMLCSYLKHITNYGWFFHSDYISTEERFKPNIEQAVLDYLKEQGGIVTEDEVLDAFPYFPEDAVLHAFQFNSDILVNCGRGKGKIHINNFHITEKELTKISSVIDKEILRAGYVLWPELLEYIKSIAPDVIDYNEQFGDIGIRKALSSKLDGKYYFNNNVICFNGHVIDAKGVISSFAKHHQNYTIDDVKHIGTELNTNINPYIGELLKYSVRTNSSNFVSKSNVKFNIEDTDRAISGYCKGEYIPISGIKSFLLFPACGFPWNEFLLESFVFNHSKIFCLMHNNFGMSSTLGAIKKRNSALTFDDVMADTLAKVNKELTQQEAIEYLYDISFIGQRRLGNVGDIIKKTRSIRKKLRSK